MAYTTAEGRERILDDLAAAIDHIGQALARLGEAYEQLDAQSGDVLESRLFRPVQGAYGRAQRTHSEFAARSQLPGRAFAAQTPGLQSQSVRDLIEHASQSAEDGDQAIAELQDSMLPVEVGDQELRAGLSQVRELLTPVPASARDLLRTVGR